MVSLDCFHCPNLIFGFHGPFLTPLHNGLLKPFQLFWKTLVCLNYLSWLYSALTISPHFWFLWTISRFRPTMVCQNHFNYFPRLYFAPTISPHFGFYGLFHAFAQQWFAETISTILRDFGGSKLNLLYSAQTSPHFWFLWTISHFRPTMVCQNHFNYFPRLYFAPTISPHFGFYGLSHAFARQWFAETISTIFWDFGGSKLILLYSAQTTSPHFWFLWTIPHAFARQLFTKTTCESCALPHTTVTVVKS